MEQMADRNQQFPSCCWLISDHLGVVRKRGADVAWWRLRALLGLSATGQGLTAVISSESAGSRSNPCGSKGNDATVTLDGGR
jgi:hypothetical protein